jgi:hypothetical protein
VRAGSRGESRGIEGHKQRWELSDAINALADAVGVGSTSGLGSEIVAPLKQV